MRRLRNLEPTFNVYYLTGAARRAAKSKKYPFSSDRQNLRTAKSQVTDAITGTMRTQPGWLRYDEDEAKQRLAGVDRNQVNAQKRERIFG